MGDFDFNTNDEPAPRGKREKRGDGELPKPRRALGSTSRRYSDRREYAGDRGQRQRSIGSILVLVGGLLAILAFEIPYGSEPMQVSLGQMSNMGRRLWFCLGAIVFGGAFFWVRRNRYPDAFAYTGALLVFFGTGLMALFLGVLANELAKTLSFAVSIGIIKRHPTIFYVLLLGVVLVACGAALRLFEQIRCWGVKADEEQKRADEEDEYEERRQRKRRKREADEFDEGEDLRPKPKPQRSQPKPKPQAPPEPLDIPEE